jgi:proteasome lid subunit RPN8/RPN11
MDISYELLEQIVAHAREEVPNECCGVVAVPMSSLGQRLRAMAVRRGRNIFASPKRFQIHSDDVYRATVDFEEAGWEIGAIYHSHTHTAPYPSQTDINNSVRWPNVEWIIVGLSDPDNPEIRSYLIDKGEVREVEIAQVAV